MEHTEFAQVQVLLSDVKAANAEMRFDQSLSALREAASLTDALSSLREEVFYTAVEAAKTLVKYDWAMAAEFLVEASRMNPGRVVEDNLIAEMERLRRAATEPELEANRQFTQMIGNQSHALQAAADLVSSESNARLNRLAAYREELLRCTDLEEAERILTRCTQEMQPDCASGEMAAILEEVKHEVLQCRLAADALAENRTLDCIEHCDVVLAKEPMHVLFLALKVKAKAADYSSQMAAVARIRALLDCGPLADAQAAMKKASARFPQAAELWELDFDIREKAIRVRNLVEQGEESLQAGKFDKAAKIFEEAFQLLPFDTALSGRIVGVLHIYARSVATKDWQAAEAALALVQKIQPGCEVPEDLAEPLEAVKAEPVTLKDGLLEPEILAAGQEAASALTTEPKTEIIDVGRRWRGDLNKKRIIAWVALAASLYLVFRLAQPWLTDKPKQELVIPDVTGGTLTIRSNVADADVLINGRKYNLPQGTLTAAIGLVPNSYEIKATRAGYLDFGPVAAAVKAGRNTVIDLNLQPEPVAFELRKAGPGTRVTVDGKLLGAVPNGGTLTSEISPGAHSIELSRDGFIAKTVMRTFAAGEPAVLEGADVDLQSTDASSLRAKRQDAVAETKAAPELTKSVLKDLVNSLPAEVRAQAPALDTQQMVWDKTNKKDANSLQAFVRQYPDSPYVELAKLQIQSLVQAKNAETEAADWNALDRNNKSALATFLTKHPNGAYASIAAGALADLDRRENQRAEDVAWLGVRPDNRQSLEGFLAKYPVSKYRGDAEKALVQIKDASKEDSAAVLAVLQKFADAWSAKDLKSLTSIQRSLDQKSLKAQLGPVKTLNMKIAPVMPPQIDGTQATVICKRQANETFSDGTARQNPATIVTYVLAKRNGLWGIEREQ